MARPGKESGLSPHGHAKTIGWMCGSRRDRLRNWAKLWCAHLLPAANLPKCGKGSPSAVSKPIFACYNSFCCIFQEEVYKICALRGLPGFFPFGIETLAPLQTPNNHGDRGLLRGGLRLGRGLLAAAKEHGHRRAQRGAGRNRKRLHMDELGQPLHSPSPNCFFFSEPYCTEFPKNACSC